MHPTTNQSLPPVQYLHSLLAPYIMRIAVVDKIYNNPKGSHETFVQGLHCRAREPLRQTAFQVMHHINGTCDPWCALAQ